MSAYPISYIVVLLIVILLVNWGFYKLGFLHGYTQRMRDVDEELSQPGDTRQ